MNYILLNDYLKKFMHINITVKDFRTFNANILFLKILMDETVKYLK